MLIREGWQGLQEALIGMAAKATKLKYVANPGNAGDALIAASTWQLFDDLQLQPRLSALTNVKSGDSIIYGGGGALVSEYLDCAGFLRRCLESDVSAVLVLPQSIRGHDDLLKRLDSRFTLVCRDTQSLARVRATNTHARLLEAPDLALRLDVERLFARCSKLTVQAKFLANMALRRKLKRYLSWRASILHLQRSKQREVRIIRVDKESQAGLTGDPLWDLSGKYYSGYRGREESEFISRDFLRFMGEVNSVTTNRLHAGIAAALMGRPTTMLDNSYGKIRAIYETSLHKIPHVQYNA